MRQNWDVKKIIVHFSCSLKSNFGDVSFRVETKGDKFSGRSSRNLLGGYFLLQMCCTKIVYCIR